MESRKKRQRLSEDGTEAVTATNGDQDLSHSKKAKKAKKQHDVDSTAAKTQSTLFVRSLPPQSTNESLAEHFSQSYPIKHATAVLDSSTKLCKGYGFVTFADHEDARRALEDFNGTELGGSKIKVDFAERRQRDGEATATSTTKPQKPEEPTTPQSSRLIIRNLPWTISSSEKLTRLFLSFGKVNQAIVPQDHKGRMRGFGIVMLRGRKNAEHALESMNGKEVDGRTLAVDWAVDRDTWQQAQVTAKTSKSAEDLIAQDGEVSSDRVDSAQTGETSDNDGDEDQEDWEDEDEDEDDSEVEDDDEMDIDEEAEEEPVRKTDNTATLFIRNLPFMTTDEDLSEHFEQFGSVRYARIVMDRETERPRGTGFVCFREKDDADACLREAPRPSQSTDTRGKKDKNASNGPSILENELSDLTGRYTIEGRILQLARAVDKTEADRLTVEGTESRNKRDRDKRRLYLLGEGTIPSNSPLYSKLSATEVSMREASAKQRKKLIDSNPSLHLSLTRLSIRNIPRTITSSELKELARKAVVGFATDVKAGKRQPISKEELARAADEMIAADKERKGKGKGLVKQAKIVFEGLEGNKVDEGSGRSRGYGFIEYHTHRSALMGLRWLNGQAIAYQAKETSKASKEDVQDRKKRLIVEFAIENAQVVKRRKDKELKARERPVAKKLFKGNEESAEDPSSKSWKTSKKTKNGGKLGKKISTEAQNAKANGKVVKKDLDEDQKKSNQRKIISKKKQARKAERKQGRAKA